ncbi:hypothetical protein [Campylobacter suis]|uniref:GspL cytoplasmic actin-ATPase-like domain-containing protein n=1 Tax=Campylobacter suis TaxID=2790657 RepID=A0ABM8Q2R9_9BACT|nr:hypothetical protein [Campylobacter suis]CAD7287150.1 hypothetical protein LMG8286_00781 [Campylobacter suis]
MSKNLAIITIDPYTQTSFKVTGSNSEPFNIQKGLKKGNFYISYIKQIHLQTGQVELSKTIKTSDFANEITQKIYTNFNLDPQVQYKIAYIQAPTQSSQNSIFNVFISSHNMINSAFIGVANNTTYIDHILPAPLLYASLYACDKISKKDTACFIRFENDDAFLAIYKDGELLTTRALRYNLNFIKDKFCELIGERVSEQNFLNKLEKYSDFSQDSEHTESLNSILNECFLYINDVLTSLMRIHNIEIDSIFLDAFYGQTQGLVELIAKTTGIKCASLSALISSKNLSSTHAMLGLYAANLTNDEINFSIFKRPEPLFKTQSGKLIIYASLGFILAFIYPAINYTQAFFINLKTQKLQSEFAELEYSFLNFKSKVQALESEQNATQKQLETEKTKKELNQNLLNDITSKKVSDQSASTTLFEITKELNKVDILLSSYSQKDENITLNLLSDDDVSLTNFIHKISQNYTINAEQISLKNGIFDSNITIRLR